MSDEYRDLIVRMEDGHRFRIRIPINAVVTYGPFTPGVKQQYHTAVSHPDNHTLRIYEGSKTNGVQTAAFRGVEEFIDASYEIMQISGPTPNTQQNNGIIVGGAQGGGFLAAAAQPVAAMDPELEALLDQEEAMQTETDFFN